MAAEVRSENDPPAEQPVPFVVLQAFEVETDFQAAWPPNDWKINIPNVTEDRASAERLVKLCVNVRGAGLW